MKKMFTTLTIILLIALLIFRAWPKPSDAQGLVDGKLAQCPNTPNCVCTEYPSDDSHFIDPIAFSLSEKENIMTLIIEAMTAMNGTVIEQSADYLSATFTSGLFRFVDDFEVKVDVTAGLIHVRSASQLGKSDFGVNRKRVETFKALLLTKMKSIQSTSS